MGVEVNLKLDGALGDYVRSVADGAGWYADVEEYLRDLIRRDIADEAGLSEMVRTELREAFSTSDDQYIQVTAEEVIARNKLRRAG